MKITKSQLKQIIKEELSSDSALLAAIDTLSQKIDGLDVSIDYLASAVTGESPVSLGLAQSAIGRFAHPGRSKSNHSASDSARMNEIVDAIVQELNNLPSMNTGEGSIEMIEVLSAKDKK